MDSASFSNVVEYFKYQKRDYDGPLCVDINDFDDEKMGARISSIFVIMVTSAFGAFFPILSSRYSFIHMPDWCFFIAKYFGSGVIVATAFIHLLEPANDNLSEECLGGCFVAYPMAFGICLIMIFVMFFAELVSYRFIEARIAKSIDAQNNLVGKQLGGLSPEEEKHLNTEAKDIEQVEDDLEAVAKGNTDTATGAVAGTGSDQPFDEDHYIHEKSHPQHDPAVLSDAKDALAQEQYAGNLLNVIVLEFGIIFHSVFVGLTLAVAGDEFVSLYIVLVFHQMFEGLGLGTRIALVQWPKSKSWVPWAFAGAYGLVTPVSIAIGLGVRNSYPPYSRTALITNGVFDSISAGILVYTGLIELMAHEFMFSDEFKGVGGFKKMCWAYLVMCVGAGLMALLGKWA